MVGEIHAFEQNKTGAIEELPPRKKSISYKCVHKAKYKFDGTIERFKARLMIRGDHQLEGFDFNKTVAPMSKMSCVRTFLSIIVTRGWELHQMDVKNVFLHGDLEEEVHIQMPPDFSSSSPNKVYRLHKSLYGLQEAPQ